MVAQRVDQITETAEGCDELFQLPALLVQGDSMIFLPTVLKMAF